MQYSESAVQESSGTEQDIPVSRAQHLVWLAQEVASDVPLYNLAVTYAIDGPVDRQRFVRACDLLVRSSDILQSIMVEAESDLPSLRRVPDMSSHCELLDVHSEQELDSWVDARSKQPLDPRQCNFDCALLSLSDSAHVFYWCQHHISSDGSNIPLIIEYLSDIYTALEKADDADSWTPAPVPSYFAFLASQKQAEDTARHKKISEYWQRKSARENDVPEFFGKVFDYSHAKVRQPVELTDQNRHDIEAVLTEPGFKSMGRELSLFACMATVMLVTGFRLHGKTTLNLGFPAHARQTPEMQKLLGMVTGLGFLELELRPEDTFRAVARKVMRELMVSFAHIESGVQTKQSQSAFSSGLNLLVAEVGGFAGMPVSTQWHYPGYSDSNSQLDLNITDFSGTGEYALSFDMATSVFAEQQRDVYVGSFLRVLETLLHNPDTVVSGFSLLSEADRQSLLQLGAGDTPPVSSPGSVHHTFEKQVALTPDNLAVKQGDQSLSFAELDAQSSAVAAYLKAQGVKPGDAVGVCFKRSVTMFPAFLGAMKAQAAFVPLDPTYPEERLAYMVQNSEAKVLLTDTDTDIDFELNGVPIVDIVASRELIEEQYRNANREPDSANEATVSDALYIMYTSGSTGLPKGVVGTHSATLNRFRWMWRQYPFQTDEVCCQKTALSFVDSIWEMFGPLLQGVPIVVIPDEVVLDIFDFVDTLQSEQITRLLAVPSFVSVMLDSDPDIGNRLRALEYCGASGEPLPLHVARAFLNKMGHCQLVNLYGSTEVTADVTTDLVTHDNLNIRMPIGRPIDGVNIYILDAQMNLLPRGCVGEICIGGLGLSGGYFKQPELNAEKFVDNPFGPGRLYKTGDLGKFNDKGLVVHHGRRDFQIKIRGHRIESAEIENTMLDFPNVRAAVAYVAPGDKLCAFYLVTTGEVVNEEELELHLQNHLPSYMIPQLIHINHLPTLSNGKINRKGLALLLPKPEDQDEAVLDPRTPTEALLVDIWKQTLALRQVDINADFFDLGGNSIAAMRIMVGAKKAGIALSLREILEIGNIAEIAIAIDSNPVQHLIKSASASRNKGESDLTADEENLASIDELLEQNPAIGGRDKVSDMFHLTATQNGILFHLLLQGVDKPLYLAQVRCDLFGTMDVERFQEAWNIVAQRHDMLRSVILHEGLNDPIQAIVREGIIPLDIHDLRDVGNEEERLEQRDKIAQSKLDMPIYLDKNPMMRVTLIRTTDDVTHLVLDWHHILMDGWSLAVLSNEVLLVYAALEKNTDHGLPEVGKFRDHVIALLEQDQDEIQAFWRSKLEGFSAITPISHKADKNAELFAESNLNILMDQDATERLYEFARRCRVTPNSVVQAAWSLLLAKYNDTTDVMFGFAVTGRSSGISNYENTVGMFVNSLPMRVKCDDHLTLVEWLQAIQTDQMELVQYESSALVDIQKASDLPLNTPMFDSLMVFQNVPRLSVSEEFPLEIGNRTVHENSPTPITIEVFPGYMLEIQVMYIKEMFVEHSVENIIAHFINIIKSISAQESTARVSDIGMMSDEAILEMTDSFNQTAREYPKDQDVSDLVWEHAHTTPDKRAASFSDVHLSYRELTDRAQQLAMYLSGKGIKANDLVGVCLNRNEDLLVTLLAVMRAGAAYLPLDPDYPQERIDNILSDADVALLITSTDIIAAAGYPAEQSLYIDTQWEQVAQAPAQSLQHGADRSSLAYVIYTSGSTGMPKGVKITRQNMVNFLHSMKQEPGITPDDRLLAVTTVSFDIAVLELFLPLISGASVDVATRETTFDGHALRERIESQGITMMQATPTTWRLLLAADWQGSKSFKALVGGEPLPKDLAASLIPVVGSLWNMYGPTETTVWSSCERITDATAVISVGKPIANTEVLILDTNDKLCPVTIPGELCIAGDGVTEGYVNRDDLTAEKFRPHPLRPESGERIYHTGDLARWMEDGRLECLGRIDSQVKLRGFRIELGEIESVLSEAEGIDHAVVNLFKNATTEFLAAYLVPDTSYEGVTPNELTLRDLLREKLPLYMIPSTFMLLDALPRMPNGKIDRKSLPNPNSSAANLAELANIDVYDLPENQPSTDTERVLSEMWEKGLHRKKLSVNSNFFDLGGNSITAMQIMSACKKKNIELSILDIFNLGTIRLCAEAADMAAASKAQSQSGSANEAQSAQAAAPAEQEQSAGFHANDDLARIAQLLQGNGQS